MSHPEISGIGQVRWISDTFGIIRNDRFRKITFTSASTTQGEDISLVNTFSVGEEVAFSGEKLKKIKDGCVAHYIRKKSEIESGTGKIEMVYETFGILSTLDTGEKIVFPGRSVEKESWQRDITKLLNKGDLVDFQAVQEKTMNGAGKVAIKISHSGVKKFPAMVVHLHSGFGVLWSRYHGKIHCPRNLLDSVASNEQLVGCWMNCSVSSQQPKNGTYWIATSASKCDSPEDLVISDNVSNPNFFTVSGTGLICAVLEKEGYLWNEFIGRICFKKQKLDMISAERLTFATFEAQFKLHFEDADKAWLATQIRPSQGPSLHLSAINFGEGVVVDVSIEPTDAGLIDIPGLGDVCFRKNDYDGHDKFDQLKGKKCQLAYVRDCFNPEKSESNRALFLLKCE